MMMIMQVKFHIAASEVFKDRRNVVRILQAYLTYVY